MFKEYDLMCCNTKIGIFRVDEDVPKRKFEMQIIKKYLSSKHLLGLRVLQTNGYISDEYVRHFIKHRVVPKNRQNIDEILERHGLSEYDGYLISKHWRLGTMKDRIWVNFYNERMEDFHPKAKIFIESTEPLIKNDAMYV